MKIIVIFILLSLAAIANGQIGLGFGNGFGNNSFGGGFGNNFGVRQPVGGGNLGNNFNNSNNNGGSGLGGNLGGSTSNTNSVSNTNNVYRPLTVGINSRRKDNNGYDYGVINAGTSPMFSGRIFQTPLRKIAGGTNSVASIRQYLRLNSREGQFEFEQGSAGQTNSNNVSINGTSTKAN